MQKPDGIPPGSMTQLYFVRPPHLRVMGAPSATRRRATRNPTSRRVASYNARTSGEQKQRFVLMVKGRPSWLSPVHDQVIETRKLRLLPYGSEGSKTVTL